MMLAWLGKVLKGQGTRDKGQGTRGEFVPRVEGLEEREVPAAIRPLPGFAVNTLAAGHGNSVRANLGFVINFYGAQTNTTFVSTEGNIALTSAVTAYNPNGLTTSIGTPLLAPFFADVDNTAAGSGTITYGQDVICGRLAFGATWTNVDYFNTGATGHVAKQNSFQVILIDRSDTGAGNFDIELNYDKIRWDTGDANGGTNGLASSAAAQPAHAGISAGSGAPGTFFQLPGSGLPNNLTDGGPNALISHLLLSNTPGRYHFQVRGGKVVPGGLNLGAGGTQVYFPFRYLFDRPTQTYRGNLTLINRSFQPPTTSAVDQCLDEVTTTAQTGAAGTTPITVVFLNLPPRVTLANATGVTAGGLPFITTAPVAFTPKRPLRIPLVFRNPGLSHLGTFFQGLQVALFSGQFNPATA